MWAFGDRSVRILAVPFASHRTLGKLLTLCFQSVEQDPEDYIMSGKHFAKFLSISKCSVNVTKS